MKIDLKGRRFGSLLVSSKHSVDEWGQTKWNCHCDCGVISIFDASRLLQGFSERCLKCTKELYLLNREWNMPINWVESNVYKAWYNMVTRVTTLNPNVANYPSAEARRVCDTWKRFEGFYKDMGERPEGMIFGRIDKFKGYNKENCRWMTASEAAQGKILHKPEPVAQALVPVAPIDTLVEAQKRIEEKEIAVKAEAAEAYKRYQNCVTVLDKLATAKKALEVISL